MAQRRMRVALATLALLFLPLTANAGAIEDLADAAQEALEAEDVDEVNRFLKRIDKVAPDADAPVSYRTQARVHFIEGMARWVDGDQDKAMDVWRACLAIDEEYQWDHANFPIDDAESVFEGLRREVRSKTKVGLGIPIDTGATKIFVAGWPADSTTRMPEGRYLVQAVCPDAVTYGKWWKYGRAPKYESMCPGGFGEAAELVAEATDEVLFDDFGNPIQPGPSAGGGFAPEPVEPDPVVEAPPDATQVPEPVEPDPVVEAPPDATQVPEPVVEPPPEATQVPEPEPEPVVEAPTDATQVPEPVVEAPPEPEPVEPEPTLDGVADAGLGDGSGGRGGSGGGSGGGSPVMGKAMLFGGGGCVAVGTGLYFAWVSPAYSAIEAARTEPSGITRADADCLTGSFNTARVVTGSLLGLGLAGATGGLVMQLTHVAITPWGVTVGGTF